MESMLPEFDRFDVVRERTGSILPGIAPTSAYRCVDGSYVLIAANGDSIFRRLCRAIGRDDLAGDPALAHNDGRARAAAMARRADRAMDARRDRPTMWSRRWQRADVPASKIYTIRDIVADAQYAAREMIRDVRARGRRAR